MALDLLLKEDSGRLLQENSSFLRANSDVNYKINYFSDDGTNTATKITFWQGTTPGATLIEIITESLSGSKTYAQVVSNYNTSLKSYGKPISQQT